MKKVLKRIICCVLFLSIVFSCYIPLNSQLNIVSADEIDNNEQKKGTNFFSFFSKDGLFNNDQKINETKQNVWGLTEEQYNSIAMLNYLAIVSQEINASPNSKLLLDEAYNDLLNNLNPSSVDEYTKFYLNDILDEIHKYTMNQTKRERLEYIYNQNKATSIHNALPDPLALLSSVSSFRLSSILSSVIYLSIDSISSYSTANNELDQKYLTEGWELDDKQAETLHNSIKSAFNYMIDIAHKYNIPDLLTLNIESIDAFVECKNNTNIDQKLQFLEKEENAKKYSVFGDYWLELANCYYQKNEFQKVLEAIDSYERIQANIFRKDYKYAKALPMAIASAEELYSGKDYENYASKQLFALISNVGSDDWYLPYFAAQAYVDLYSKTDDSKYLDIAYTITKNNVNELIDKQESLNNQYINPVQTIAVPSLPKGAKGEERTRIKEEIRIAKEYNKSLETLRETELIKTYDPLILNCDLLFALASNVNVSDEEKSHIDNILRDAQNPTFLSQAISNVYCFNKKDIDCNANFNKNNLSIPVTALYENPKIVVTVKSNDGEAIYDDWILKKVERPNDKIDSFIASFTSKSISKQKWNDILKIEIEIFDSKKESYPPITVDFKTVSTKKFGIISSIEFVQIK